MVVRLISSSRQLPPTRWADDGGFSDGGFGRVVIRGFELTFSFQDSLDLSALVLPSLVFSSSTSMVEALNVNITGFRARYYRAPPMWCKIQTPHFLQPRVRL